MSLHAVMMVTNYHWLAAQNETEKDSEMFLQHLYMYHYPLSQTQLTSTSIVTPDNLEFEVMSKNMDVM